jgi:hypothetical protein
MYLQQYAVCPTFMGESVQSLIAKHPVLQWHMNYSVIAAVGTVESATCHENEQGAIFTNVTIKVTGIEKGSVSSSFHGWFFGGEANGRGLIIFDWRRSFLGETLSVGYPQQGDVSPGSRILFFAMENNELRAVLNDSDSALISSKAVSLN